MSKSEFLAMYLGLRLKCEIWSRCMGYYRNYDSYNYGKKAEFRQRVFYTVKEQVK